MKTDMKDITALLDEVKQTQREALRQANLLPRVRAGVEGAPLRRRRLFGRRGLSLWLTSGLVLAGAATALVLALRPAPLAMTVGDLGTPSGVGAVLDAPAASPLPLHFSDGTALALEPGARLAVAAVDAHGATVVLERGTLNVGVVHLRGARWAVRAGRYEVAVTGTRFQVSFDPDGDALTVRMHAGSVLVRGPGISGATALGAGEMLHAVGRTGHVEIASAATAATAAPTIVAAAPAPPAPAPSEEPAPEAPATAAAPAPIGPAMSARALSLRSAHALDHRDRAWMDLAHANHYRESLEAAEHTGFSALCRRLDANDLVLLGDVSRLAGDPTRAEEAYLTARKRFPNVEGPVFAMGLVAFEHRRRFNEAAAWFSQYLESYPNGQMAREAAGRLMESWQRAGRMEEAQKVAVAYLKKYPTGPHSRLARQIAGP
jgi:TolA-binding protein